MARWVKGTLKFRRRNTYFPKGLVVTEYCFTRSRGSPFKKHYASFLAISSERISCTARATYHYTTAGGCSNAETGARKPEREATAKARSFVASLLRMTERAVFWAKDRGGKLPRYIGENGGRGRCSNAETGPKGSYEGTGRTRKPEREARHRGEIPPLPFGSLRSLRVGRDDTS